LAWVIPPFVVGKLWANRQERSTKDFSSRQGLKSEGILYVFLAFQTAELAEKIRRPPQVISPGVS
jgi:hypothetical protein